MIFFEAILSYLILAYMFVLPIFPSKYKLNGIPINGDALLAFIILVYIINFIINKNVRKRLINYFKNILQDYVAIFAGFLLVVMFFSISYSKDTSIALNETIRFGTFFALYMMIKLELRNKAIKNTVICFMIISILISIIGLAGMCFGVGVEKQATNTYGSMLRMKSTLENSNNLAAFLMLSIFPFLSFTFNVKKLKSKLLFAISTFIVFICILLTQSRNAIIALAVGFCFYIILYNWKSIIFFIAAAIGVFCAPLTRDRILQITDVNQNISRIKLWKIAIKMIKDHPILGVGNGNYKSNYSKYETTYKDVYYNAHGQFHPHNIFLKIQCELGVLGTIAFVSFITSIFFKIRRVIKSSMDDFFRIFYKGFLISFVAFIMLNLLDNFLSAPKVIAFFWILIAVAESILCDNRLKSSN